MQLLAVLGFPAAEAIEAIICIEVKEIMRPKSLYEEDEGCVDCHIMAMVDVMDEMLTKNIAVMKNPKQAWALSLDDVNFTIDLNIRSEGFDKSNCILNFMSIWMCITAKVAKG